LTLSPSGKDELVIKRHPPVFFETRPTGLMRKLDIGGNGNGPLILPNESYSYNLEFRK
jgi:hypothetical protein